MAPSRLYDHREIKALASQLAPGQTRQQRYREIAEQFDTSYQTIRYICEESGNPEYKLGYLGGVAEASTDMLRLWKKNRLERVRPLIRRVREHQEMVRAIEEELARREDTGHGVVDVL